MIKLFWLPLITIFYDVQPWWARFESNYAFVEVSVHYNDNIIKNAWDHAVIVAANRWIFPSKWDHHLAVVNCMVWLFLKIVFFTGF